VAVLAAFWVIAGALVPLVQDEGYYVAWSRHLALGYLDHPPGVALFVAPSRWAPGVPLAARAGTIVASVVGALLTLRLARAAGLTTRTALVAVLALRFAGFLGLGLGFVTTPDSPLFLAWSWALVEAARALRGERKRWLAAGIATGLGLWGKYTMVVIGPVFLWGLVRSDRAALRTAWPYLGGLLALLVWSPQLAWNATHGWQTLAYQLRHGLAGGHDIRADETGVLPHAEPPRAEGPEADLTRRFPLPPGAYHARPPEERPTRKWTGRLREYLLGELGLCGFLVMPFAARAVRWWQRRRRHGPLPGDELDESRPRLDPRVAPLLAAGWVFPLVLFGVASLSAKTELNWPAMYLVSASVWLAPWALGSVTRWLLTGTAINLACVCVVGLHALHPYLPIPISQDRILRETRGFDLLSHRLAELDAPVFGTNYQLVSLARFYSPGLRIGQWPGAARPSELTLRRVQSPYTWADLAKRGEFWMVSFHAEIAHIPGADAVDLVQLRDCRDPSAEERLEERDALDPGLGDRASCQSFHLWYLARYRVTT